MRPEPKELAARISSETGLPFEGSEGRDSEGHRWLELQPAGHAHADSFALRTTIGWRNIFASFRPGSFATGLLEAMSGADENGRAVFASVLSKCTADGAEVELTVNGRRMDYSSSDVWTSSWQTVDLGIRRGMLAIDVGDQVEDERLVLHWTARLAAAVLALLPLEAIDDEEVSGLPEGAKTRVEVNRYERDRRNRAAALAIHGFVCKGCRLNLSDRYGHEAVGLIEVHHVVPVSMLGAGYIINPRTDLVPLCPNCHSVAHRRNPPFSVADLQKMLSLNAVRKQTLT